MQLFNTLPPQAAIIADLRMTADYADAPLTSGATTGETWVVVGTDGNGVQAYRQGSGRHGIWEPFTTANSGLQSNRIVDADANLLGYWFTDEQGGLTFADAELESWQPVIGQRGFAQVSQEAIQEALLSADLAYLAVLADEAGLGVYNTQRHDWIGKQPITGTVQAMAWFENSIYVGASDGVTVYQVVDDRLQPNFANNLGDVNVTDLQTSNEWLLAITADRGVIGLQAGSSQWEWLIGVERFPIATVSSADVTAVALQPDEVLWIGVDAQGGRYDLATHNWEGFTLPGEGVITALAVFGDDVWAGSADGLYRYTPNGWETESAAANGVQDLIVADARLWVVLDDGGVGFVDRSRIWQTAIGSTAFATNGFAPQVTDVVYHDGAYWVASADSGVASYQWDNHTWTQRGEVSNVVDLVTTGSDLWRLDETGEVARWSGSTWRSTTAITATQMTRAEDSVLALDGHGVLHQLGTQNRYFESAEFDPQQFRAISHDTDNQIVHVGSAEGLFTYNLSTHSWTKAGDDALVDVQWASDQRLTVDAAGGLRSDQTLLPSSGVPDLAAPHTAAIFDGGIWLADNDTLATYVTRTHRLTEENSPEGIREIRQLRSNQDALYLLGESGNQLSLYYQTAAGDWQATGSIDDYALSDSKLVYLGTTTANVVVRADNGETVYFQAIALPQTAPLSVARAEDGSHVVFYEDAVYSYSHIIGNWIDKATIPVSQVSLTDDGAYAASSSGLFRVGAAGDLAQISAEPTIAVTQLLTQTYVLLENGSVALLQGDELVEQVRVNSSGDLSMGGSGTELWVAGNSSLDYFELENGSLIETGSVAPPATDDDLRLFNGDNASPAYFGSADVCFQLLETAWQPCPTRDYLAQPRREVADPFGRFVWEVSFVDARLRGTALVQSNGETRFQSDQITDVASDGTSLFARAADGTVWEIADDGRQLNTAFNDFGNQLTQEVVVTDSWRWQVSTTHLNRDRLDITHVDDGSRRQFANGDRFADTIATAVAAFDGAYWIGTQAGLWHFSSPTSLADRQLIADIPTNQAIRRLLVSDSILYVQFDSGAWRSFNGLAWASATARDSNEALEIVNDPLGRPLLWEVANGGVDSAEFITDPSPKFKFDAINNVGGTANTLWLATESGVVEATLENGMQYVALDETLPASFVLQSDGEQLYAQDGDDITYRLDGTTWITTTAEGTIFGDSYIFPIHSAEPLTWVRNAKAICENDQSCSDPQQLSTVGAVQPWLDGVASNWHDGRLAFDIVNDAHVQGDALYLATQNGVVGYAEADGLTQLVAKPSAASEAQVFEAIGETDVANTLWVRSSAGDVFGISAEQSTITPQPLQAQMQHAVVQQQAGNWRATMLPLTTSQLTVDVLESDPLIIEGALRI